MTAGWFRVLNRWGIGNAWFAGVRRCIEPGEVVVPFFPVAGARTTTRLGWPSLKPS